MSIFKTSLFGYNKKEVHEYFKKQSNQDNTVLEQQKNRIYILREENTHLTLKLNGYKHREKAILAAMIDSRNHAESILKQSRQKAINELQGLKMDINYIKSIDNLTPYQLALAIDRTCSIIADHIKEIRQDEE